MDDLSPYQDDSFPPLLPLPTARTFEDSSQSSRSVEIVDEATAILLPETAGEKPHPFYDVLLGHQKEVHLNDDRRDLAKL